MKLKLSRCCVCVCVRIWYSEHLSVHSTAFDTKNHLWSLDGWHCIYIFSLYHTFIGLSNSKLLPKYSSHFNHKESITITVSYGSSGIFRHFTIFQSRTIFVYSKNVYGQDGLRFFEWFSSRKVMNAKNKFIIIKKRSKNYFVTHSICHRDKWNNKIKNDDDDDDGEEKEAKKNPNAP